ncbi:MAG: TraR/DksA C4-type zinc finger protein [Saprospiraceae bacterium]|nr:TraR/DksA C4-type zinc finger protein [Saprospiraceae bacterium]|tara:strand:+ start:1314 stop:1655 length:342 start_codon:yes stop_codon:yes gene_type:complete
MDSSTKAELKSKIKKMITSLQNEIIALEELTKPISPENSLGRITRMDAINNKSVAEASLRNRKRKLGKMHVALVKVDEDSFGICQRCKKNINPQRLLLMPESERCVNCAATNQ